RGHERRQASPRAAGGARARIARDAAARLGSADHDERARARRDSGAERGNRGAGGRGVGMMEGWQVRRCAWTRAAMLGAALLSSLPTLQRSAAQDTLPVRYGTLKRD